MRSRFQGLVSVLIALTISLAFCAGHSLAAPARGAGGDVFGLMISEIPIPQRMAVARELGVSAYRPLAVFLNRSGRCEECEAATDAGLTLVLTVRTNGREGVPTTPPTDFDRYKADLRRVLERYRPAIVVVENEANHRELYYSGTADQYLSTLRAACQVAHSLGIRCTDSGLTASGTVAATVKDLYDSGKAEQAVRLARQALQGAKGVRTVKDLERGFERSAEGLSFVQTYLSGLREAGADYANFHWYHPETNALRLVIDYLRRASGLPVMTNETGQQNDDPTQTENQLRLLRDLGVAPIVWFSVDTKYARGLVDRNGRLRPTGEAFRRVVRGQQ